MPLSARKSIPSWYSSIPGFTKKNPKINVDTGLANTTLKHCVPFLDAMQFGYIQEAWQDFAINVEIENEFPVYSYAAPTYPPIVGMRPNGTYSIPSDYHQIELFWHPVWVPETPKGYSVLITHPLNRHDLPFTTLSAVIDSDTYSQNPEMSKIPFIVKKNFSGIIPKGTPMYQIIPFKRDDWSSEKKSFNEEEHLKVSQVPRQSFWGGYKKNFWIKKSFK